MAWIPGGSRGSGGWTWVGDGLPDSPMPGGDYYGPTATTSDTDKPVEHGRVLLAVGEGPFLGLVNGLKSVYLNDVPIQNEDGTLNFNDVSIAVCNGTVGQNPIVGFNGAESEVNVGQKVLKATPIVRSISNTTATHARVKISVPSLQTIDATTGKTSSAHLEYKIEVQPNGGSYQAVTLGDDGVIEKQFTSKLIKGYKFALPGTGPWNIRLTRLEVDSYSQYLQNDLYFESLSAIVDGNYSYPMTALIGVACSANQFTSIPKVTADWYGRIISVPANYDPIARRYETTGTGTTAGTWDGTFKQAWSDNPAWVFYDMVTNNLFGCGLTTGAPDKWLLYQIAQYCDVMVSDGVGGMEPRFTCSVNIESRDEAIKVIGYLASIFRGSAYWAGGSVMPIQDKDEVPSAQFTNSNVVDGKFTYTSSAKPARHTACIVKYNDPTNSYESTPLLIQDNDAVARYGYNPLEVVAYGCSSRGQASRLGLMALTTELSQTEGIKFSTAMEGIALRPGKIIKVHDAFRFGKRFGGRVMASTTTAVTLDAPVTLEGGKTYQLSCTLPSGAVEVKAVSTGAGTVSSISVSSAFSVAPQVEGQWILVANDFAPLLYRVMGIKEGTDGAYEVTGLIHNPDKYDAVESGLILDAMPDASPAYHAPVTNLTLTESMAVQTDRLVSTLLASWTPVPDITGYTAVASRDGGPWQPMTIAGAGATLADIQPGSWKVRVVARYATGDSTYTESAAYTTTGFSTTTSPAQSAQNGVNAINSVDALTNSDKIALMESWNAELQTQTSLDTSATALSITTEKTNYDNAITALSTGLIAAGAPSNWAAVWPDGTTLSKTGIASSLATWWAAIASKRATLHVAISQAQSSAAQAAAISAAATDAASKVSNALTQAANDATAKAAAQKQAAIDAINASVGGMVSGATSAADAVNRVQTAAANAASVAATALAQGSGNNLLSNVDWKTGLWATGNYSPDVPAAIFGRNLSTDWELESSTEDTAYICHNSAGVENWVTNYAELNAAQVPVSAGKRYIASVYSGAHRCRVAIFLAFLDAAGARVGYAGDGDGTWVNDWEASGGQYLAGYKRIYATLDAPAGAVRAFVYVRKWATKPGEIDSYGFFVRPMLEEVPSSVSHPSPWTPSAVGFGAAQVAADAAATSRANLAETNAKAHADGIVDAEEARAIADAQAKYDAAKSLADAAQAAANTAQAAANVAQGTANAAQTMPTYASPAALPSASGFAPGYGPVLTSSDWSLWKVNDAGSAWDRILFASTGIFGKIIASQVQVDDTLRAAIVDAANVKTQLLTVLPDSSDAGGGQVQIGGGAIRAGSILAKNLTISNFDNLIPNPNSEQAAPAGGWPSGAYENVAVSSATSYSGGTKSRLVGGNGSEYIEAILTPPIPVSLGDSLYFEAMQYAYGGGSGAGYLQINFLDASGARIDFAKTSEISPGIWQKNYVIGVVSANVVAAQFLIGVNPSTPAGTYKAFDALYARRCSDASVIVDGTLQALFARIARAIQSTNYAAGSAGNAPTGFCLSSTPFTTTFKDGTTDSGCLMELGGSANFGGYKVATINKQVMTAVNRIVNGSFWRSISPWDRQPHYVCTLNVDAYSIGSSSPDAMTATQNFNAPGYVSGNVYLKFVPSEVLSGPGQGQGTTNGGFRVSVYLRNHTTGVETLVYQQSVGQSSAPGSWTPGQQSINVTSLLSSAPGGYGIAIVYDNISISANNSSGSNPTTATLTLDMTGFELIL